MDIVSTKMKNTIATNASINSDGKKVRYKIDSTYSFICDHITIDNCYYLLLLCKE